MEELDSPTPTNQLQQALNWTGSKIDLVELIYALHHSKIINTGNIDLKEILLSFSTFFNIELDDSVYRTFHDIKNRKTIKTRFLNKIAENLNDILEDE